MKQLELKLHKLQDLFLVTLCILILFTVMTSACYVRNCPLGGKRSPDEQTPLKVSLINQSNFRKLKEKYTRNPCQNFGIKMQRISFVIFELFESCKVYNLEILHSWYTQLYSFTNIAFKLPKCFDYPEQDKMMFFLKIKTKQLLLTHGLFISKLKLFI